MKFTSHFSTIPKKEMKSLSNDELEQNLSNESLRIRDEDELFQFVSEISKEDRSKNFLFDFVQLLNQRPKFIMLEHSSAILEICSEMIKKSGPKKELAIDMIDKLINSFGKSVETNIKRPSDRGGVDIACQERKEKSENFVRSFKKCAIELRKLPQNSSNKSNIKAKSILAEGAPLLK